MAPPTTIAGAWFFELVLKLKPCPLCLEQRWAYYIGVPLGLVVALAAWRKVPRAIVIGGLLASTIVTLVLVPAIYTVFEEGWRGIFRRGLPADR